MKRTLQIIGICAVMGLAACKGNPNTQSGDSTGTGSGGARVPGNETADTTKHDSTTTSPKSAVTTDSASKK